MASTRKITAIASAVYDLGGGTFDVSVLEIAELDGEHQFEVLRPPMAIPSWVVKISILTYHRLSGG
jgi:hypothetical protein